MPNLPAPLDVFVSSNDLQKSLTPGENAALAGGQLDGSDVWYEYLTQEDDKVRPTHAALHGTVWHAGDPNAPMPPIDYGCRCFIKYVARPGSEAAQHLPPARSEPTTQAEAWGAFMDKNVPGWSGMLQAVEKLPAGDRLGALALAIEKATGRTAADSRKLARMAFAATQDPIALVETDPRKAEQARLDAAAATEKLNVNNDAAIAAEAEAAKAKKLSDDLDAAFAKQQKQAEIDAVNEAKIATVKANTVLPTDTNEQKAAKIERFLKGIEIAYDKELKKLWPDQAILGKLLSSYNELHSVKNKLLNPDVAPIIAPDHVAEPIAKQKKTKSAKISDLTLPPGKSYAPMPSMPSVPVDGISIAKGSLSGIRKAKSMGEIYNGTIEGHSLGAASNKQQATEEYTALRNRNTNESQKLKDTVLSASEAVAVNRFSNGYDYYIRFHEANNDTEKLRNRLIEGGKKGQGPLKGNKYNSPENVDKEVANVLRYTKAINSGMAKQPEVSRWPVLYRGMRGLSDENTLEILHGNNFSFGATSSTSTNLHTALSFSTMSSGSNSIVFRMRDTLGMPMREMSHFHHENEVLVTGNQKWTITNIIKDFNSTPEAPRYFVDMEPKEGKK